MINKSLPFTVLNKVGCGNSTVDDTNTGGDVDITEGLDQRRGRKECAREAAFLGAIIRQRLKKF